MSWLSQQKANADAAKAEERKKLEETWALNESLRAQCKKELENYVGLISKDFVGGKTKDGKVVTATLEEDRAKFFADKELILEIFFWSRAEQAHDGDGYSWATGRHYTDKRVKYYRNCPEQYNSGFGGPNSELQGLYDYDLAKYLLHIMDI